MRLNLAIKPTFPFAGLLRWQKFCICTPRGRVILYKAENFLFIKEGMRFEDTGAD